MGARVAAHFANAGVPSLLLSRASAGPNRSATAAKAIETAAKQKPASFFVEEAKRLVKPGNYDDNFDEIADCDWVIETVAEDLQIKRDLWRRVETVAKADAILSTCTSGIQLSKIAEGFPPQFCLTFPRHAFLQPDAIFASARNDSGPGNRPGVFEFVHGSANAGWARAWCYLQGPRQNLSRTRRMLFWRHHATDHRWRMITRWKRSTRSPAH